MSCCGTVGRPCHAAARRQFWDGVHRRGSRKGGRGRHTPPFPGNARRFLETPPNTTEPHRSPSPDAPTTYPPPAGLHLLHLFQRRALSTHHLRARRGSPDPAAPPDRRSPLLERFANGWRARVRPRRQRGPLMQTRYAAANRSSRGPHRMPSWNATAFLPTALFSLSPSAWWTGCRFSSRSGLHHHYGKSKLLPSPERLADQCLRDPADPLARASCPRRFSGPGTGASRDGLAPVHGPPSRGLWRLAPARFPGVRVERAGGDRARRLWRPTRHPVPIKTEGFRQAKLDYLHHNPVRKGLVRQAEPWRFSSASYWTSGGTIANDVLLSAVQW